MRKLLTLITIVYSIQSINAQNSIDFTKKFNTINYQQLGHANGLQEEQFSGSYRIYTHAGLRMGYKIEILPNPNRKYIYKGVSYTPNEIPELNDIKITRVGGTLNISSSHLSSAEQVRKITIEIGGYLDQSGSLGGNNIEITGKAPKEFESNTPITFVPSTLYWDANKVQIAIEDYINKKNKIAEDKLNQEKYAKLLSEADKLYNSKQYDQALNQYYLANSVKITDKTRAEEGIAKTRKAIEEEAKKEKTANAHTYKSGECRLAGTASDHYSCPLCIQQDKTETAAKQKEDNRVAVIRAERLNVEEKQKEEERIAALKKKKEEERLENERNAVKLKEKKNSEISINENKNNKNKIKYEYWKLCAKMYPNGRFGPFPDFGFVADSLTEYPNENDWKINPIFHYVTRKSYINLFSDEKFKAEYYSLEFDEFGESSYITIRGHGRNASKFVVINRKGEVVMDAPRGDELGLLGQTDIVLKLESSDGARNACDASLFSIKHNKEIFRFPHNDDSRDTDFPVNWSNFKFYEKEKFEYNSLYNPSHNKYIQLIQNAITKFNALGCFVYQSKSGYMSWGVRHPEIENAILILTNGTCLNLENYVSENDL